jgi:hypothetical protein
MGALGVHHDVPVRARCLRASRQRPCRALASARTSARTRAQVRSIGVSMWQISASRSKLAAANGHGS